MIRRALIVAGVLMVTSVSGSQQLPTGVPDFSALNAYIAEEMRGERIPGLALVIVRGAEVVHARGFGTDGAGRSVTPQTSFILGSMSKSFTALAIMQLVEEGRVELDAPVQRYLPGFRVADSSASTRITVRHLLNHTGGIPALAPRGSGDTLTLATHVGELSGVELRSAPGVRHEYSSPNYLVLGAIIEKVSGLRFDEYVRMKVFAPLEMQHSYVSEAEAKRGGLSQGHRYWFGYPRPVTLRHEADRLPTAAIISSAGDLGHFMIAQLGGGSFRGRSVLSADGVARLHQPGVASDGFSYAMGWRISRNSRGNTVIHHGGIVPHFRGKMVMLPEQVWGVAVLTNVSSALPLSPASHRIADNIGAYLAGEPLPAPGSRFKFAYFVITAVVLVLSVNQVRQGIVAWRRRNTRPAAPRRAVTREAAQLLLPLALLVGLPLMVGLPWAEAVRSLPDIAYWLIAIASVDIAVRLFTIFTILRPR